MVSPAVKLLMMSTGFNGLYAFNFTGAQDGIEGRFTAGTGFTGGDNEDLERTPWTFTRATAKRVEDHEGYWRYIPSGAVPLSGFRVCYNPINTVDMNPATSDWTFSGGGGGSVSYVTSGIADPDGGTGAHQFTIGTNGGAGGNFFIFYFDPVYPSTPSVVTSSVWMRVASGTQSLRIKGSNTTGGVLDDVTVTTTWQKFAVTGTSVAAGTTRWELAAAGDIHGNFSGVTLYMYRPQLEEGSLPSESLGSGTDYGFGANGVKYFTTTNGNSIDGNGVVTEAAGSTIAIDDARGDTTTGVWGRQGYVPEPARTNLVTYSYDLTNAAWTATGTSVAALNATGITGASNTAATLTDNDGAAYEFVSETVTIASSTNNVALVVAIKKDADTSRFVGIELTIGASNPIIHLNTSTGELTDEATGYVSKDAVQIGDWWWVTIIDQNSSQTSATVDIYPARGTVAGTGSTAATGSCIVGFVGINDNASTRTSPIITNGSTATRNEDDLHADTATETDTDWTFTYTSSSEETVTAVDLTGDPQVADTSTVVPNGEAIRTLTIVDGS